MRPISFADVETMAQRYGFSVVYGRELDAKKREHIYPGAAVVVSKYTRGTGTETIARYRVVRGGPIEGWGKSHIELEHLAGYKITPYHFDEWMFVGGHPADFPEEPWARLGKYEWIGGRRVPHTDFHLRQAERESAIMAPVAPSHVGYRDAGNVRAARHKVKRSQVVQAPPTPKTPAEQLVVSLRWTAAAKLDEPIAGGGVRDITPPPSGLGYDQGPTFRSLTSTLLDAYKAAGGTSQGLANAMQKGQIEVLKVTPGLRRGDENIEYVVRSNLVIS
jgi:hypothetical protein